MLYFCVQLASGLAEIIENPIRRLFYSTAIPTTIDLDLITSPTNPLHNKVMSDAELASDLPPRESIVTR